MILTELLQIIANIALIIFSAFYVVGTFWKPLIINKKSLLKKILAKHKINLISMEFDQALLKIEREKAVADRNEMYKRIEEMDALKKEKEAELVELKKLDKVKVEDWEAKNKEISDIEEQGKKLVAELQDADKIIKMAEGKLGQYTKEISLIERSLQASKELMDRLC